MTEGHSLQQNNLTKFESIIPNDDHVIHLLQNFTDVFVAKLHLKGKARLMEKRYTT